MFEFTLILSLSNLVELRAQKFDLLLKLLGIVEYLLTLWNLGGAEGLTKLVH